MESEDMRLDCMPSLTEYTNIDSSGCLEASESFQILAGTEFPSCSSSLDFNSQSFISPSPVALPPNFHAFRVSEVAAVKMIGSQRGSNTPELSSAASPDEIEASAIVNNSNCDSKLQLPASTEGFSGILSPVITAARDDLDGEHIIDTS